MDASGGAPTRLPSGRHDLPPDLVVRSQRDRLMSGMAEAVASTGYPSTTVEDICSRAGVSTATFYELFRDKDDCLAASAETLLGEIVTIVTGQYSPDKAIRYVIRDAIASVLALMAQRPAAAHLIFVNGRYLTPAARQAYTSGVTLLLSLLDQVRVEADPNLESPRSSARAAVGSIEMLIRTEVLAGRAEQLPAILPQATYAALVAFLGRDQAQAMADEAAANPPKIELTPFGRAHL
jgi:AcrR family transcriptional regulator